MSEAYIGEIRSFGFNFAPYGWGECNGQLLSISQYTTLFSILGTTFGGNGTTNFGLPNLQGNSPMHWGNGPSSFNTVIGEVQGSSSMTLTSQQIPAHTHTIFAANVPPKSAPERSAGPTATSYMAQSNAAFIYQTAPSTPNTQFNPGVIMPNGSSLPHDNMQPYLTINFCICMDGIFPSRN